ncbi:helix-turn-helix transcriptional regulator [Kribbella speibonae]|uniref:Response regulator transcription factor n=1 Tax=Kribbella speibonae TaxID=1572660 RepID=A0ABY2A2B1_9ACTN|nr:response regulator transcription factor [Kribbella speibonae]TCC22183.1 response regulator transcription factor [Kribbella speibonae]
MEEVDGLLAAGERALGDGDWSAARTAFDSAVSLEASAAGLSGLGDAHWWLGDTRAAFSCWERAYALSSRTDPARAVFVALGLSLLYDANFGNRAAAQGWAARAVRVASQLGDPVLAAWASLAQAGSADDPARVVSCAKASYDVAVSVGDHDLELCALSLWGAARINLGQVLEGMALLDEALAGALGGARPDTVVFTSCLLMRSCVRGGDFLRVVQWTRSLDSFIERYGCPYLHATCRASYGAVLVSIGDWPRAESELTAANELARDAMPAVRAEAAAFLAELRLGQGQFGEARRLLTGFEERPVVQPVLAALYLASGETATAVSLVRRQLDSVHPLEEARLREVLGSACLAAGDIAGAAAEAEQLSALGTAADSGLIAARAARLCGRALTARGKFGEAVARLTAALSWFGLLEMPLEVARTRMLLADAMAGDDLAPAVAEVRIAHAVFEDLGATADADAAAAWLRSAGATVARRLGPRGLGLLTKREYDVLAVLAEGLPNPEIAARLYISRRTVEHHVASILSKLGVRNRTEAAACLNRVTE